MKYPKHFLAFICFLSFIKLHSQASFTLAPNLCEGAVVSASVNTGTMSAIMYSWAAIPSTGVVFSSTSTQTTTISFNLAGTYTVGAGFLTSTGFSYTTNVIVIDPYPIISVSPTSTAICLGNSTQLTASSTGTSYAWTPTVSLFGSTGPNTIASPTVTTIYTVSSAIGNCAASETVQVSVTPLSTVSIVSTANAVCTGFTSTLTAFGSANYTWTSSSFTSPVLQQSVAVGPGIYTVTAGTGTCASAASFTVGLMPNLSVVILASPATLTTCIASNSPKFSKPVHLTASGAGTYIWFPFNLTSPTIGPEVDVRPSASTCYTVVGSTAICSGTGVVCVNVIPQFTAAVTPSAPVTCLGDHTSLSIVDVSTLATGPASSYTYTWMEALNAPPISISDYYTSTVTVYPQNATTYTAEVRDSRECVSSPMLVNVTVNACVGIDKQTSKESQFKIYPNPANDKIAIQSASNSTASIEIMDAIGKTVIKEKRNFSGDAMTQNFNIAALPAGVYFIRISADDTQTKILKLIKN
ncbi:hypothetical protein CNR22_15205 [Sphingobacteriaceae bacterium]|nr:hypothetical protein CNR22_15205 [Sphingobacteriaceae bacterium]